LIKIYTSKLKLNTRWRRYGRALY